MKLSSVVTTLSALAVTAMTALGFSSQAQALTFSGVSSGVWGKPTPGSINPNPQYSPPGSNLFTWGDADDFGTGPNKLIFDGNPFSNEIGSLFKIGDLTYFNGTVVEGTSVESVPLNLHVSFGDRLSVSEVFDFDFHLVNTPNTNIDNLADEVNADFVFVGKKFGDRTFTIADQKYTLELTGFRKEGISTDVSEFRVNEGEDAKASIFAKITQVPDSTRIPEPGTIVGLSVLGIYLIYRRKSSQG